VATGGGGAGDVWMRAHGGTGRIFLKVPGGITIFSNEGQTNGVTLAPGGGSWTSVSDRNAKENFQPVDDQEVLAKVAALPLSSWNYKSQDATIRHLGPMAQDFHATFGVGEHDRGITTVDADGVALAAIQGLNHKVESDRAKIAELEAGNAELKSRIEKLERLMNEKNGRPR
jgi:Chaperone of endosialidase